MEKTRNKVYVATYYQNSYQRERIEEFVNTACIKLLNKGFEKSQGLLEKAKEVWIVLGKGQLHWLVSKLISYEEHTAINLGISVRYFKINHRGKYVGKTREVERGELSSLLV